MCIRLLMAKSRKLFTRALAASGRDQLDWSADYRLFSRCRWSPCHLFRPILCEALRVVDEALIAVALDDTLVKKTGKKIKGVLSITNSDLASETSHPGFQIFQEYPISQAALCYRPFRAGGSGRSLFGGICSVKKLVPRIVADLRLSTASVDPVQEGCSTTFLLLRSIRD
jgi:hypothetical protein